MAYTPNAATTSDTQTLTNKTIDGNSNTLSNIAQSAVTGLSTALSRTVNTSAVGAASGVASLDGGGKVPVSQLPNSIMAYQGVWNASTNTPTLANGTGDPGDVYRVSVSGTALGLSFEVGDYIIYNGSTWEKSDTTDAVASVNGYTGNVTVTKSDVGLGNVDDTSDATKNAATATLTNKTLTNPKVNQILDTLGNPSIVVSTDGSPVYISPLGRSSVQVSGIAGSVNYLRLSGNVTGQNPSVVASGTDANVGLELNTRGTGTVRANGIDVVTTTGTQALSNKTISGAANTLSNIAVASLATTGTPSSSTYLRGDGSWQAMATGSYNVLVGDGASTSITVTHNLGTRYVAVSVFDATTYEMVAPDVTFTSTTALTLTFGTAPAAGAYRCVVISSGPGLPVASAVTLNAQTGTAYTLALADAGNMVTMANASAVVLTVPTNASAPFPVGTRIDLAQTGAGQVSVAGASGVTINASPGLKIAARYCGATITKTATDTWLLIGALAA